MNALGFSLACRIRYSSPPALSSAPRIIVLRSAVSLFGRPLREPPPVFLPAAIVALHHTLRTKWHWRTELRRNPQYIAAFLFPDRQHFIDNCGAMILRSLNYLFGEPI